MVSWSAICFIAAFIFMRDISSGNPLKTALFKSVYLHTNDAIIKAEAVEAGIEKRECAARCIKKSFHVCSFNSL